MKYIKTHEWFLLCFMLVVNVAGIILSYTNEDIYQFFIREDSIVEWMTAGMLGVTSLICFARLYSLRHRKSRIFLTMLFLMGLVFCLAWVRRFHGAASAWSGKP